jgi:hypothetical protein
MFSHCRILVLFLAFGVFAAPETVSKASNPFIFQKGIGVIYPKVYSVNGMSFSYKKITARKESMSFSWSLSKEKADLGTLSIFTLSGKMVKSFDVTSPEGSRTWSMPRSRMASGVYFAKLSYGKFNKSLKIVY